MIKKVGSKYVVVNHTGKKKLSKLMSKAAARQRLLQIEYFKHKNAK